MARTSSADLRQAPPHLPGRGGLLLGSSAASLKTYTAAGGYQSLARARELPPEAVVAQVDAAGLRGRGGSGFPTARKWRAARAHPGPRFLVANGSEGEPGSLKDRVLMQCSPHRVLEGALIAAHAVEAERVFLYVNATFTEAVAALRTAIRDAREAGILDSRHHPTVEMVEAPPCYVAGEETAALEVIEGRPPRPRRRPPYPAVAGLWGQPTVVNNVETLAAVEEVLRWGPDAYRRTATLLVTLSGGVERPGVYEVPLGIPLGSLIDAWGGGVRAGAGVKAVSPGGLSTAYLPASALETPFEYEALRAAGSSVGCASLRVIPQGVCMVEELEGIAAFFASETCGQCGPCVQGTRRIWELVQAHGRGNAEQRDLGLLTRLGERLPGRGICGYLAGAAAPVASAVRLFWEDFESHIRFGTCRGKAPVPIPGRT